MDIFFTLLSLIQILAVPATIVLWFIVSLVKYRRTPFENTKERQNLRIHLIISGIFSLILVLTLFLVIVLVWLIIRFSAPVSFM